MAYKALPDPDLLRKVLFCDPDAGSLTWLPRDRSLFETEHEWSRWNTRYAGKPAFNGMSACGYLCGTVFGGKFYTHRIIWAMTYGPILSGELDHINGDRTDNRIANLRNVSRLQNCQNRKMRRDCKSGVVGVYFEHHCGKWRADIRADGKRVTLGLFATVDEAAAARKAAEVKYGFHPNHGR